MYISYSRLILANFFIIKNYQWSILNSPISTNARSLYSVHFQNIQITARLKSHLRWRSWGLIMLVALALLLTVNGTETMWTNVRTCTVSLLFTFLDSSQTVQLFPSCPGLPIFLKNPKSRPTCYGTVRTGEISILTSVLIIIISELFRLTWY